MFILRLGFIIVLAVAAFSTSTQAQRAAADVTQWRGANRDGAIATVPAAWPERLTQRWKIEIGSGYATPLVVGNRIYIFSRLGDNETMSALDADSGKVLWRTGYPATFTMNSAAAPHGPGPKSTPVFANGRLFSIGMTGIVTAFDAAGGKQLWQKPRSTVETTYTSHSFSPVVEGNTVIFHVGGHDRGALTAFDMNTGDVRWSWNGDGPGYGSPIVANLGGTRQLVTITQGKLVGVDVSNGALLWERPFVSGNFTNSITPILYGDTVIAWGNGGPITAVRPARRNNQWIAETAWENMELAGRLTNWVVVGDMLFGLSARNAGQYFAADAKTGKTLWMSEGRQAPQAAIQTAGDQVFSLENDGELVIMRVTPTGSQPVRRYKLADTDTWTQPTISGNRVFVKDVSSLALWTVN